MSTEPEPVYADCCGAGCDLKGRDGPCWGEVTVIDEVNYGTEDEPDWEWVHVCEGHHDMYDGGGEYKPKPGAAGGGNDA